MWGLCLCVLIMFFSFSFQVSMGVILLAVFDCSQVRFNNKT